MMNTAATFSPLQIQTVNDAVAMAEELVSNQYKLSANEWLQRRYDVKTVAELAPDEIVHGPFAQIIRYKGQPKDKTLGSFTYDFYKICLQDHAILSVLDEKSRIDLFPFTLYIVSHELIHIVRFSQFLQNFDASEQEKLIEEKHVHQQTRAVLGDLKVDGILTVLNYYKKWHTPVEGLRNP